MRKQFVMTDEQLGRLLEAGKPVPYMVVGGMEPRSPQENVNAAWAVLGKELGFDPMSVRPVPGECVEYFTAEEVPTEDE